jgi:hypothetical protein
MPRYVILGEMAMTRIIPVDVSPGGFRWTNKQLVLQRCRLTGEQNYILSDC